MLYSGIKITYFHRVQKCRDLSRWDIISCMSTVFVGNHLPQDRCKRPTKTIKCKLESTFPPAAVSDVTWRLYHQASRASSRLQCLSGPRCQPTSGNTSCQQEAHIPWSVHQETWQGHCVIHLRTFHLVKRHIWRLASGGSGVGPWQLSWSTTWATAWRILSFRSRFPLKHWFYNVDTDYLSTRLYHLIFLTNSRSKW